MTPEEFIKSKVINDNGYEHHSCEIVAKRHALTAIEMARKETINSVWHDASERPQIYGEYENDLYPKIPCLVLGHLSTGYGYGVRYWNVAEQVWDDEQSDYFGCTMYLIEKWAYLDDLLPTKEGEK